MSSSAPTPLVTIAVPSLDQGQYLGEALASIFADGVPVEVFVADGGSIDGTEEVLRTWAPRLSGWRSHADEGQAAAINECIDRGSAPFVGWLNSDDCYLPGGLGALVESLQTQPEWAAVSGRAWNIDEHSKRTSPVWVEAPTEARLAVRCTISQPASLIRRSAWEGVGGLDVRLRMAMDYDLWWRLLKQIGPIGFVDAEVAANREHRDTKTRTQRRRHYGEAITVVRRHYGKVPLKWWLYWPIAVGLRGLARRLRF